MRPTVVPSRPALVLASGSPQRRHLLEMVGVAPRIESAGVDERPRNGETPLDLVLRLALDKAAAVDAGDAVVIGADTMIELDGEPIGKPADDVEAAELLARLNGRTHAVHTGVAVRLGPDHHTGIATTAVTFRELSAGVIEWYVGTGEPRQRAGAYAIQGQGGLLVERIEGSYHNVVGLPLTLLDDLLTGLGWPLVSFAAERDAAVPA